MTELEIVSRDLNPGLKSLNIQKTFHLKHSLMESVRHLNMEFIVTNVFSGMIGALCKIEVNKSFLQSPSLIPGWQ